MRVNLVLIGPPGSGKGTQAVRIAERYRIPHISTGNILRAAVRSGSALGRQVADTIASGGLVSDALITDLVRVRLGERDTTAGFILDGFPRTVAQAHELDRMRGHAPLLIALIAVANEEIVRRLSRRRVCGSCGLTQSVSVDAEIQMDPCPYCGGSLVRRPDDDPATVTRRLSTYDAFAQPVIDFYQSRPSFASIDGLRDPDVVTAALCRHIDASSDHN